MKKQIQRILKPDIIAIGGLILLWLLFFWRILTPNSIDQVSIRPGDFTDQFLAFGAYQFSRLSQGEIPLWNPYNNGGLPFIADTQAAALYPPRLITIFMSNWLGSGWSYNALQLEVITHVLVYTLLMYAFVRRLTKESPASSPYAAFVSAIIAGYGGFMTGYPILQLAILEAGIWLPLALLGILEATRGKSIHWVWVVLAGWGLGVSWMAGHPQTSWFATYALVAYMAWCCWKRFSLYQFVIGLGLLGIITIGTCAVQLLPAAEYLGHTMRSGLGFDAKSGGFPPQDLLQLLIPNVVSLFSPLYIGITGLILASIGLMRGIRDRLFFAGLALAALLLSLGDHSIIHHITYLLLPGANAFRGPERAAYVFANATAILAGLGTVTVMSRPDTAFVRQTRRLITGLTGVLLLLAGGIFIAWLGDSASYGEKVGPAVFSMIMATSMVMLLPMLMTGGQRNWRLFLLLLVVFEVFSITVDNSVTFEPISAQQRTYLEQPELVRRVHEDAPDQPYRVDGGIVRGQIGLYGLGNSGTAYQLADIRGISPLFLDAPHAIIQRELPAEVAWELFAVQYVFTDAEELPVASQLIARDYPDGQTLNLHRLENPRPFAHLTNNYIIADDAPSTYDLLRDLQFDERATIILDREPSLKISETLPDTATAKVSSYQPETFTIQVNTPVNTILSVSQVDYPGWKVTVDGTPAEPILAYNALTAVPIPAGEHIVTYRYNPLSFRIGAISSSITWILLIIAGFIGIRRLLLGMKRTV